MSLPFLISPVFSFGKKPGPTEIPFRAVGCKKCGSRIQIPNRKLDAEFSVKCSTCDHRGMYSEANIVAVANMRRI